MNMKKLFLLNLPYLLFVYPFDKLAQAFRLAPGADLSGKLLSMKEKPVDGDGDTLPDFTEGQTFDGAEVTVTEHFTQPPKPYTEDICCERGIRNHP